MTNDVKIIELEYQFDIMIENRMYRITEKPVVPFEYSEKIIVDDSIANDLKEIESLLNKFEKSNFPTSQSVLKINKKINDKFSIARIYPYNY